MAAETEATTTLLPRDDVLDPRPRRIPARQERKAARRLWRAIPWETERSLPASGEPERQAETLGQDKPRRNKTRRALRASLAALLLASVAGGGYLYWDNASHYETTDDAFIAARQFAVFPKVSGYITAVPVTDNQHVTAGQVIARIDDRDYRNALAEAQAQVAAAQASIETSEAQIVVQQAQIRAHQAHVDQAQPALVFAQQQAKPYQEL